MKTDIAEVKILVLPKDMKLSEQGKPGLLKLDGDGVLIKTGDSVLRFPFRDIRECALEKGGGIGTFIHLESKKQVINFDVPRINIADWFIINNSSKTKRVHAAITQRIAANPRLKAVRVYNA